MGETKLSKGPWKFEAGSFNANCKECNADSVGSIRDASGCYVAKIDIDHPDGRDVERANARLIAAAPMLLEALKRAEHLLDATARFLEAHPVQEYTVFYDETTCDGSCLMDDCNHAREEAQAAIRATEPVDA